MTVVSATDALSACDLMNNTMSVHLIRSWNGRA
jgi:hypothetical protein